MMKKLLILLVSLATALPLVSQQEAQFTQFMNFKLGLNPGYAGSEDSPTITALVRNQWLGLEGAPQTQLLAFDMPVFNKRVGIGGSIVRRTIGFMERYTAQASYAYRVNFGRGKLGIGLQSSIRLMRFDFNEAQGTQPVELDATIPVGIRTKYVPNLGAGLYYHSARFFAGVSIPRFLKNDIDIADANSIVSREIQHVYIMAGGTLALSDEIAFRPQVLLKYLNDAPFDADFNFGFIFQNRYTTGISYRLGGSSQTGIGESLSLLVSGVFNEKIELGISYDYTLSQIRNYSGGSIEAMVKYYIGGRSDQGNVVNPLPGSEYYK